MMYQINIYKDNGIYDMEVINPDDTINKDGFITHPIIRGSYHLSRLDVLEQTLDFIKHHAYEKNSKFIIVDADDLERIREKYNMSHHK